MSDAYIEAIRKTGFVLENSVAEALKTAGWTVISNKYYEDDHSTTVREVDIVAYTASTVQNFDVYTVLIVSCKKSQENVWALLARDLRVNDPNSDWWPMHTWSNDPALSYKLNETGCAKRFHEEASAADAGAALMMPPVDVFAFQELSKATAAPTAQPKTKGGKSQTSSPKNDATIFGSITSLMKAQAYELAALPNRKKSPCVYQFNLLTVADTDLLRMRFSGEDISCAAIDSEHYIGRYIINRRETFSRIQFVRASAFGKALREYDQLHDFSCKWFAAQCDDFYKDIVKKSRYKALIELFKKEIAIVKTIALISGYKLDAFQGMEFTFSETMKSLIISMDGSDELVAFLKQSKKVTTRIRAALKKVYRYEGSFTIVQGTPF